MGKRAQRAAPKPDTLPPELQHGAKISIASSGYGEVTSEFCYSLVMAVKSLQCPIRLDYERSCYVHRNRNVLMQRALESDSTHLMFIDTDIAFPRDGIQQLVALNKPIAGGAYNLKRLPEEGVSITTVKPLMESLPPDQWVDGRWVMDKSKPFECRALPTGFMLIDLRVIRGLEPPPFGGDREGNPDAGPRNWFDFGNYAGFVGEDVFFCDFVRNQGVEIWCDPTIKLGHIGPQVF